MATAVKKHAKTHIKLLFSCQILLDLFTLVKYFLRDCRPKFKIHAINGELNGKISLGYLGPVLWNSIPNEIRNSENLSAFIARIKIVQT